VRTPINACSGLGGTRREKTAVSAMSLFSVSLAGSPTKPLTLAVGRLAQSAPFLSLEVKQGEISHETKTAFTTDGCE